MYNNYNNDPSHDLSEKEFDSLWLNNDLNRLIKETEEIGCVNYFITVSWEKYYERTDLQMKESIKQDSETLLSLINEKVQLWTYLLLSWEKDENGEYYLIFMVGIRSLIGYNENILLNLKILLNRNYAQNTCIIECKTKSESLQKMQYCLRNYFSDLKYNFFYYMSCRQNMFASLDDFFNSMYFKYGHISTRCIKNNEVFDNLDGLSLRKIENSSENNKYIILSLWNYYLILNDYYIYDNNIYKKKKDFIVSFQKVDNISILYEKFNEKIVTFFIYLFPIHFENYNFYDLLSKNILEYKSLINTLVLITNNKFIPDYNLMEFKDGLYNIKMNKFFSKEEIKKLDKKNTATLKFYDIMYKHIRKPELLLDILKKKLDNDEEKIKKMFIFIACIFLNNDLLFDKKKVFFLVKENNNQQLFLIIKLLINFFSESNINLIIYKNFFNFNNNNDLKVIVKNDDYITELKNFDKDYKILDNFFLEMFLEYKKDFENINEDIIKKLGMYEPHMLIYCNKFYFNSIEKKKVKKKVIKLIS